MTSQMSSIYLLVCYQVINATNTPWRTIEIAKIFSEVKDLPLNMVLEVIRAIDEVNVSNSIWTHLLAYCHSFLIYTLISSIYIRQDH